MSYRPDSRHPEIKERSIRIMADHLMRWDKGQDPEEYMEAAREVMEGYGNGYTIARDLEHQFDMSPDAELVEICDDKWGAEIEARDELVREWVAAEGVKVPFSVGDKMMNPRDGVITKIHEDSATCSYNFANGRGFGIADYEDVRLSGAGLGDSSDAKE